MNVLEKDVEQPIKEWADQRGILNVKLTPMGQSAYPDRIFFLPGGRPLILEIKRPGEKPKKLQKYIINKLKVLGYDVRWTDSKEEAIRWLTEAILKPKA